MEQITVLDSVQGNFGPQLKDAKGYLSFSKFYQGATEFVAGTVLEVDLFVGKKGARYINSLKVLRQAEVNEHTPPKRGLRKKVTENITLPQLIKTNDLPSAQVKKEVDWDEVGRGKTASLFVQAILQNPNVTQSLKEVDIDTMESLIWELVDLVFKTRKEKV